jgi:hypothetical protein
MDLSNYSLKHCLNVWRRVLKDAGISMFPKLPTDEDY